MGIRTRETSDYFPKVKRSREEAAATAKVGGGSKSPKASKVATTATVTVTTISPGTVTSSLSGEGSVQAQGSSKVVVENVDKGLCLGEKPVEEPIGAKVGNKGKGKVVEESGKGGGKSPPGSGKGPTATTSTVSGTGAPKAKGKGKNLKKNIAAKGKKDVNSGGIGDAGGSKETCAAAGTSLPNGTGKTDETSHGTVDKGAANKLKSGIAKANSKMKKGMRIMMERTNKILERSKNCKKQTKKGVVKPRIPPARSSARLGRKNSGDGSDKPPVKFREEPLRTVELIKRPLELRDPATKLLYLASLSLYPTSDPESDTTPIVIVSEEVTSPGGKKGKTRSVEFPLMPNWRGRYSSVQEEPQLSINQSQSNRGGGSLLLQIAPAAAVAPSEESSQNVAEVARPVKTAKRKSQNSDATSIVLQAEHLTVSRVPPPLSVDVSPTSSTKESSNKSTPTSTGQNLSISIPPVEIQPPQTHNKETEPAEPQDMLPVKIPKKRKSVDTILKEMEMRKFKPNSNTPQVVLGKQDSGTSEVKIHSSNPILEGLMKNPVKSKAPKRKSEESTSTITTTSYNCIQSILPNNSTISINPISMTVPLQPAPGLPINVGLSSKEFTKAVKGKKQRSSFELPNPVPIPIPPGLLSFASLVPNSNPDPKPTEKPKKPRKPRTKKPKDNNTNTIMSPQPNSSLVSPLMNINSILHPSLPYLPPHLEAFFQTPPLLSVPQPNVQPRQPPPEQALDLCVKPIKITPIVSVKPKKAKDLSKSILKPLTTLQDDAPLNLVMSRNDVIGTAVQAKVKENAASPHQELSATTAKQGGSLDSVKQMLGRLHTRIAPAVNGVQLITIE